MPRFELKGRINLDGNAWEAGLMKAKRSADVWSSETAGMIRKRLVQAFAVGAMWRTATSALDKATEIRDRSARMGVDPEMFQHLDYAARQSGASIDDVSTAMRTLARMQQDATEGSKEALQAFDRFGLVFDDIAGRKPDELFMDIAKAVERGKNAANLLADLQTLMGRGGQSLIPVFQSNFSGMMAESRAIGAPLTGQQVTEMGQTADALTKTQQEGASLLGKAFSKLSENVEKFGPLLSLPFDPEARQSVQSAQRLQTILDAKLLEKIEKNTRDTKSNTDVLK